MNRIEYSPNPPPQTLTEQSSKDLALYLQNELTQISSFIGGLSDKPNSPTPLGFGSVVAGVETASSNNIVSIVAAGVLGNYAKFTVTVASPITSACIIQTTVEGFTIGFTIPLVGGATAYVSDTTFDIIIMAATATATTPVQCTFDFICYGCYE